MLDGVRSIEFTLGLIFGVHGAFYLLVLAVLTDTKVDVNVTANIVIAFATVVATTIHISSVRQQRKDRIWDINKSILLELSHALSQVIRASEFYLQDEEYTRNDIGGPPSVQDTPSKNVFRNFKEKQDHVLVVYKSLMSEELISVLQTAKDANERIAFDVNVGAIENIEAYRESIPIYEKLQKKLDFFIAEMSGIKNI